MTNQSKSNECPSCGKRPSIDVAHRKTCVNFDCKNYGVTYLHHEWLELHEDDMSVDSELDNLMAAF